jgi:hypothetical protein
VILLRRDRSLCCASLCSAAPGDYCHTPSVGDQTCEARSGLHLAHTTIDRVGPDRVPKWRIPRFYGGISQREVHRLEFQADQNQGTLLRDYANRNSYLIYVLYSPTTASYTYNATFDVLCIVVVKDFVLTVHLTVCSALTSDHPLVLIDTTSRSSFKSLLYRPDFTRMDWATFWACLEDRLPGNPSVSDEEAIDKCVEELNSAIQEATAASVPRRRPRADPRPPLPAII